jgi:type IV pilus assembly protein PilC
MPSPTEEPRPPKRPRPTGGEPPKSKPKLPAPPLPPTLFDGEDDVAGSTFRPNPGRAGAKTEAEGEAAAPRKSKAETPRGGSKMKEPKAASGGPNLVERIIFGRVGTGHLAQFCRQFGSYLDAGVPILRTLESLQAQFAKTALGPVIERVALGVRRGDSLTDAMSREPQAFDGQFLSMMTVAETRGGVPETLKRMAAGYEARQRLFRQARSAMIQPIVVMIVAFAVGMLLTVFILPGLVAMMEEIIKGRSIELPLPTRILMAINRFMITIGWLVIPLAAVGSVVGLIWLYRKPRGKAFLDEIVMRLPVLGKLFRMIDTARFCRVLSTLLEAGVDIGASLDLTASTMMLVPFRRAVTRSREAVVEGSELSEALADTRRFTPDVIAIVESGEETGKLPETLERLSDDYEERIELMVKNLGSLIQPLIMILIGGVVLFIALAFFSVYVMLLTGLL